ncbi:MAG: hypothetical protein ACTHKT_10460 [Solirubrobacterales bacterium]
MQQLDQPRVERSHILFGRGMGGYAGILDGSAAIEVGGQYS